MPGDRGDLADDGGDDELAKVDDANVVEQAEVEEVQLQAGEVEAVENAELADLQEGVQGLELQQAVEVEDLVLEEALELQHVEVVDLSEAAQQVQLQRVDVEQVVEVDLLEAAEVVDQTEVEGDGALIDDLTGRPLGDVGRCGRGDGRGGGSEGGQSRDDDGEELHFDEVDVWNERERLSVYSVLKGLKSKSTALR